MSQAHARRLTGSASQQGLDQLLNDLPPLLTSAFDQYVGLLKRGSQLVSGLLPDSLSSLTAANACCEVPTQDCPPRCVAEICWQPCPGETVRATVNVKNTSSVSRSFSFTAGELGPAKVQLEPGSAQLAPGQSVALQVTVSPDGLKPGETYTSEILVRGAYEQCVKLKLRQETPAAAPQVDVEQGEVPEHISELKWYRHWQCVEPCAAPTRPTPNDPDRPPTVGAAG